MGEARSRGSRDQRVAHATQRNKADFYRKSGLINRASTELKALQIVHGAFLVHLQAGEWESRKAAIRERLSSSKDRSLARTRSVRDEQDEIAWYLYLAELAITDPLCQETNQASRTLPFLVSIGQKWENRERVVGLDAKIKQLLTGRRREPDGLLFEIMVALSYAANGWSVQMLNENPPAKSPDLLVRRGESEFYVECKRQSRRPKYAERERQAFLEMWEGVPELVQNCKQWLWFDIVFHEEIALIPSNYLRTCLAHALPLGQLGEYTVVDDAVATIRARKINHPAVQRHMAANKVKDGSSMLRSLLGADWAPLNTSGSMALEAKRSTIAGCENLPSAHWVEEITWATGCTRACDASLSIAAKARDIKKLLVDAVRQVPKDKPSIIHIAIETLEGRDVDHRRAERIRSSLANFKVDRPVAALFLHSIQCNEVIDKPWEVDETVDWYYGPDGEISNIPKWVLLPPHTVGPGVSHWTLHP